MTGDGLWWGTGPVADLLWFAGVMVLGQFSPGPDMILVTRTALAHGRAAGGWTALGIACGLAVHATVAVAGTAALLARGGVAGHVVRWMAAGYLAWLGLGLLRSEVAGPGGTAGRPAATASPARCWRRGLLCNLLNPKVALFLAAAAAPFLTESRGVWWPAAIWLVVVVQGLVLWVAWAWLLQVRPVRGGYLRAARWIDLGFAAALWLLAGRLVIGG